MKQKRMGILGPRGTHSEAAAHWLAERLARAGEARRELVPFAEIDEVLLAAQEREIDSAFVPVENSLEGAIHVTLDILARAAGLTVLREVIWPVHNALLANCPADAVRRIVSHPQPISQCRAFLKKNYPTAEIVKVSSTARAAEIAAAAKREDGVAAIGAERAAGIYGLNVLAREIEDSGANCTRFFEVARQRQAFHIVPAPDERALVICQLDGSRAGSLVDVLLEFSRRGINMTRIESRPARTRLGDYIFFFDLDTDAGEKKISEALAAVRGKCSWLKAMGSFPVLVA